MDSVFQMGPRITILPVIHGSGDFSFEVRRRMLAGKYDALAVPLPESFQQGVEAGILDLPNVSVVVQEQLEPSQNSWLKSEAEEDEGEELRAFSYVPVDPCQPVIAAIRSGMEERCPIHFVDLETTHFVPYGQVLPDPFALKKVSLEQFCASLLPALDRPEQEQRKQRIRYMAHRLRELAIDYERILFVCSAMDWPWIREAYFEARPPWPEPEDASPPQVYSVDEQSLYFFLGELPFISSLYETARAELENDENLAIDGVKELLISSRDAYRREFQSAARKITPQSLRLCLQYVRNLTLMQRRFSPELVTILTACKQTIGDAFALSVLEQAKKYCVATPRDASAVRFGIGQAVLPDRPDEAAFMISRLPGPPLEWRNLDLQPKPTEEEKKEWQYNWDPNQQCSWPPEDTRVENFRATIFDRARQAMGAELAKTEKFTTSLKDGIDIRDTLRHWYEGDLYVKEVPPIRGNLHAAVVLFDSPSDPREYPWRTTWYAEHEEESTLAFYATNYRENMVGPGICAAQYGGAMFLFPPVAIPDIWHDPSFDFAATLEERLLAATCRYSQSRHVAIVSPLPPGPAWRQIAREYGKQWVHVPLSQFNEVTLEQMRLVHVLNGHEVRSYADQFIRRH